MKRVGAIVTAVHLDRVSGCSIEPYYRGKPHIRISLWDDEDDADILERHLEETALFIRSHIDMGHDVLVHCAAGVSRSTSIGKKIHMLCCFFLECDTVIYYMMRYRGYSTVAQALNQIRKTRPYVQPNDAFIHVLKRYERRK